MYGYVLGDPVGFVDPDGLEWEEALTGVGVVFGGLLGGGTTLGLGTGVGAVGGGTFGNALGKWVDDMQEKPAYPIGDPRRNKEWVERTDRTREMGKDTTKGLCKVGKVGKF